MNRWEKEVQRSLLKDEQKILRVLKLMYEDVLDSVLERIAGYYARYAADPTDAAAIYQLRYQQALADQLDRILTGFDKKNYTTIEDYLNDCYTSGFVGAMYDIHRQGVPVIAPIQQENIVRAITTDSKISVPMYTRLGTNIAQLKTAIAAEVTRGIASGMSWHDTAAGISRQANISAYNAMRIARTEGHRIACEAQMDGCKAARDAGADVVKEWSAALDDRTREHHKQLDGQLRELDADFEVDGIRVPYPGNFGRPEEDINCRCALLQRARWALDKDELERLKDAPAAKELAETESFTEFKGKYLEFSAEHSTENPVKSVDNSGESGIIESKGSDWKAAYGNGETIDTALFKQVLAAGEINTTIFFRDQQNHVTGAAWKNQVKQAVTGNGKPKSRLYKAIDPQSIVDNYAGTGIMVASKGNQAVDEFISMPYAVGVTYDKKQGRYVETHRLQIKYTRNGTHVFPVIEGGKKQNGAND